MKQYRRRLEGVIPGLLLLLLLCCTKDREDPARDNPFDPTSTDSSVFDLTAESRTNGVLLSWSFASDVSIDGYKVYRSVDSLENYTRIADSLSVGSHFDSDVQPDQVFYYKVSAFRGIEETSLNVCRYVGPTGLSEWLLVDEPAIGTVWTIGDTMTIEWRSYGTSGRVKIEITSNGGTGWDVITSDAPDNGSYEYVVPGPVSSTCLVRITDTDGSPTGSSAIFTMAETQEISVVSPGTGLAWVVGTVYEIRWETTGETSGNVDISLARDGSDWETIFPGTVNDGVEPWQVTEPASANCQIRIIDPNGTATGYSGTFSIVDSSQTYVSILAPTPGSNWFIGSDYQIIWQSNNTSGTLDISLSRDAGTTWQQIEDSTPDDGSAWWTVTGPPGASCYIRIADVDGDPTGYSQEFTILAYVVSDIEITSPTGGDNWEIGTSQEISWTSEATSGTVTIVLSRNNGSTWEEISTSAADDDGGSLQWAVTGPPSAQCLVRIADVEGEPADTSDTFAISEAPPESILITDPLADEEWEVGSVESIQWTSANTSGSVRIELSRDGAGSWETIDDSTQDDGSYSWAVVGPASTSCVVRVADIDGQPADTSGIFTIAEAPPQWIVITNPSADEEWEIGSVESIQWSSVNTSGYVAIQLSRSPVGSWETIVSSAEDDGSYQWTVLGPASESCLVRVADIDGEPSDTSGIFTIVEPTVPYISIRAPLEGAEWGIGSHRWVEWDSEGTSGLLDISLSRNGGTDWESIVNSTEDDSVYEWDVTGPVSSDCIFVVEDSDGSPSAQSGEFAIVDLSIIELVTLPGGSFQMGHYDSLYPDSDQIPEHEVTVSPFYISKYEITQLQYAEFDPEHESHNTYESDNNPVEQITWYDAAIFCNWLSEQQELEKFYNDDDLTEEAAVVRMNWDANGYRLPTEAEWEYACRAGTQTDYYNGDADTTYADTCELLDPVLDEIAWYCANTSFTISVGNKLPNAFGLYDMSGNVFEWCNDWYIRDYYEYSPSEDPHGPEAGYRRVLRGGSWYSKAFSCTSANRDDEAPGEAPNDTGFRVVRPAE